MRIWMVVATVSTKSLNMKLLRGNSQRHTDEHWWDCYISIKRDWWPYLDIAAFIVTIFGSEPFGQGTCLYHWCMVRKTKGGAGRTEEILVEDRATAAMPWCWRCLVVYCQNLVSISWRTLGCPPKQATQTEVLYIWATFDCNKIIQSIWLQWNQIYCT